MALTSQRLLLVAVIFLAISISFAKPSKNGNYKIKSATFLSPKFILGPGSVANKYYYDIKFPRGHIALKSFNGEVVDESGNPVPLYETYLHHWVVERYYQRIENSSVAPENLKFGGNQGTCQGDVLRQYFGLGSETRKTATHIPDPFGIEIGNLDETPEGYEEKWGLNVHAIDARGVEDRLGCNECLCELYNVTAKGMPDYKGGLRCCRDNTQCRLKPGFKGVKRNLYLRYTVKWVEWDDSIIPVKVYIFDVTDTARRNGPEFGPENGCSVEYDVMDCNGKHGCVDAKKANLVLPNGGYVIYGVAHQHTGGVGSTLYGQDGRVLCSSKPIYGKGREVGNEAGFIVGMTTCYPKPGSVKIGKGEKLVVESSYSRNRMHTGVMGLFYILVADKIPQY